jgi:hypothetical protein
MATLVLRQSKGSPLTNAEVDANFTNLNDDVATKLASSAYTAADVLTKIKTVDGTGTGLDTDLVRGLASSATLPTGSDKSSVVTRDATGNTAAAALTLTGALTGTTATFSGAVNVASISISGGSIPIGVGGTGATNAPNARDNLGVMLGRDVQAWSSKLDAYATPATGTYAADTIAYWTSSSATAVIPITSAGRTLLAGANQSAMQTVLGVRVGTDVQPFSSELTAHASLATTGIIIRSASNTIISRSITGVTGDINVSNGDGISGNPSLSIGSNIPRLANNNTFAGSSNTFSGTVFAAGFQISSDARLKENVETLNSAVETVLQLRGVSFLRNDRPEIGLIAQEVEKVLPQVVQEDPAGYKTIAYANMVGLLVEAIKEQNKTIKELTTRLEKLEK